MDMLVSAFELREGFGVDRAEYIESLISKVVGDGMTLDGAMQYIFNMCLSSGFDAALLDEYKGQIREQVAHNMEW